MTNHLTDLIPPKRFAERYIARPVPGTDMSDIEVLRLALTSHDKYGDPYNVMMTGPTGPGKTSAVMALCAEDEIPCATVNLNGMTTVEDLVGQLVPTEGRQGAEVEQAIERVARAKHAALVAREAKDAQAYLAATLEQTHAELALEHLYHEGAGLEWRDGVLVRMMKGSEDTPYTVLLADEINFGQPKVMAILNAVADARRQLTLVQHEGETVTAHDGFRLFAAMNPHYEGTRPLNKALRDRFAINMTYDYCPEVEAQFIDNKALLTVADRLRTAFDQEELQTPVSPRALIAFESVQATFGTEFAIDNFVALFEADEQTAVREALNLHLGGGSGAASAINEVGEVQA